VDQSQKYVGMLKMQMWTRNFIGTLGKVRVTHSGDGGDQDIEAVRFFVDTAEGGLPSGGDGRFQKAIDTELTDPANPVTFKNRAVDLQMNIDLGEPHNEAQRTIEPSTRTYFVVLDMAPGATPGRKHGVQISGPSDLVPLAGNGVVQPFSPVVSTEVVVRATRDEALLVDVNSEGCPLEGGCTSLDYVSAVQGSVTQAAQDAVMAKFTMKTRSGSALWSGLKLDRWFHSDQQGGAIQRRLQVGAGTHLPAQLGQPALVKYSNKTRRSWP